MTKSTSVQAKAAPPKGDKYPRAICSGIEFDELTPEEQQLETTKRAIWKKLMARLQFGCQGTG